MRPYSLTGWCVCVDAMHNAVVTTCAALIWLAIPNSLLHGIRREFFHLHMYDIEMLTLYQAYLPQFHYLHSAVLCVHALIGVSSFDRSIACWFDEKGILHKDKLGEDLTALQYAVKHKKAQ